MNIDFDAARHLYRINGAVVPNVTRVLADLYDWDSVPAQTLERKRQIGSVVHRAIELDVQNNLDESSIDPQAAGYFEAWRRFGKEKRFACHLAERQVGSWRFRYAGKRSIRSGIAPSATTLTQYELSAAVKAFSAKREARHR